MVESVPYRHFGDFLRALVRHVNAALDVRVVLPVAAKQLMAMVLGGICGVLTLIGGAGLLWRRLTNQRVRATSTTPDIIIMSILLIQCLLGLSTIPFSAQYPDGSEMMKLVGWAQSIVTFPWWIVRDAQRRSVRLPPASGVGNDHLPALPVHPTGACVERAV